MGSFAGPNTVKDSLYNYHICTTSGTFTPNFSGNVEVLVVAGGGGGGMDMGGGGGGGGVLSSTSYAVTAGTGITVTVGAGGVGGPPAYVSGQNWSHQFVVSATAGGNSVFGSLTAVGGGYGGSSYYGYTPNYGLGGTGGSGGGSSGYTAGATTTGAAGTAGQGNKGGNAGGGSYYSGGGGGAGAAGADGPNQPNGGAGILNAILGKNLYWGGGGGGAAYSSGNGGNGGIGGGGGGAVGISFGGVGLNDGESGASSRVANYGGGRGGNGGINTGGGGGGGTHYNTNTGGGNGGSGIVIIRYLKTLGTSTFNTGGPVSQTSLILSLDAANTQKSSAVEVLVVAGGAGGGSDMGGGGGGGGVIYKPSYPIVTNAAITITVGAGGAGAVGYGNNPPAGSSGGNSVFGPLVAFGGGGGGSGHYYPAPYAGTQGQNGGSGGGDSPLWGRNRFPIAGLGTNGQGYNGGAAAYGADGWYGAGGGGGAGARGSGGGYGNFGGGGGRGFLSDINGTSLYWGGGGGGGHHENTGGNGGIGGGGGGSGWTGGTSGTGGAGLNAGGNGVLLAASSVGGAGGANTGGGGGGGGHQSTGGAGGSGIVIVRYYGAQKATGGTVTSSGGYTIHTFTSSGTFTPTGFLELYDSSELNNKITTYGPTWSSSNGGYITFDGVDDYIDTSFPASTLANSTLEAVIYDTKANSGWRSIIQFNTTSDGALYMSPSNYLYFYGSAASSSLSISSNQWTYVAASYNGSTITYCVNGVTQSVSSSSAALTNFEYLRIGAINASDTERFKGNIALAKVYNRALTSTEMLQNFQALRGRFGI